MERIAFRASLGELLGAAGLPRPAGSSALRRSSPACTPRGWYHRDLYLHHFAACATTARWSCSTSGARGASAPPRRRWFVKDLAALLASVPRGRRARERLRFLARYLERAASSRRARAGASGAARRAQGGAHRAPRAARTSIRERRQLDDGRDPDRRSRSARRTGSATSSWRRRCSRRRSRTRRFERVTSLVRAHLVAGRCADGPCEPPRRRRWRRGEDEAARATARSAPDAALLLSNSLRRGLARVPRARAGARRLGALRARRSLLTHASCRRRATGGACRSRPRTCCATSPGCCGDPRARSASAPRRDAADARRGTRARSSAWASSRASATSLCCPGAAFGAAKLWPPERFAAVLDALHARARLARRRHRRAGRGGARSAAVAARGAAAA